MLNLINNYHLKPKRWLNVRSQSFRILINEKPLKLVVYKSKIDEKQRVVCWNMKKIRGNGIEFWFKHEWMKTLNRKILLYRHRYTFKKAKSWSTLTDLFRRSKWEYRLNGWQNEWWFFGVYITRTDYLKFISEGKILLGVFTMCLNDIFRLYNIWVSFISMYINMRIRTLIAKLIEHKYRLKSSFEKGVYFFILSSGIVYRFWKGIILYNVYI